MKFNPFSRANIVLAALLLLSIGGLLFVSYHEYELLAPVFITGTLFILLMCLFMD
jgi:hypothetical protein